jgi:hypothetical protein
LDLFDDDIKEKLGTESLLLHPSSAAYHSSGHSVLVSFHENVLIKYPVHTGATQKEVLIAGPASAYTS